MMKKLLIGCGLVILAVYSLRVYSDYKTDQRVTSFYHIYKNRSSELKSFKFVDIGPIRDIYAIHIGREPYYINGYWLFDLDDKKQIKWIDGVPKGIAGKYESYIKKYFDLDVYSIMGSFDTTGIRFSITSKDGLIYLIDSMQISEYWTKEISDRTNKSVVKLDGQWYYIKYK